MTGLPYWLAAVAAAGLVTIATRSAPFIVFRSGKIPPLVDYLQRMLPPVVMVALVVNSYKAIDLAQRPWGLDILVPGIVCAGLHAWRRNALLSIAGATTLHMVLIRIL